MSSKKEESESEPKERSHRSRTAGPLPQDTVVHLMKSGTEFLLAMDTLLPKNVMTPEIKEHYKNIKKETMLLFRAFIDSHLKDMEEKAEAPAPRLRKIDLE
ncbi:MAG: hypothetical protein NT131_01770 [Methanomassiliicoccales archaeon]|nr:hypothetical protein [Methanomassiliicoccales archaeon]